MNCVYKLANGGAIWRCTRQGCGHVAKVRGESPPKRNCGKAAEPLGVCQHLGPATGFVECPACQGNVRLKVFACEIHKSATMKNPINGLACCAVCREYQPMKDTADADGSAAG